MQNSDDREAILRQREAYMDCFNSADVDGCVSFWDDEGALLPPNEPAVKGLKALRSFYEESFRHACLTGKMTFSDVQVSGGLAVATGTYAGTITPRDGSEPTEVSGKFLEAHRQQADGSWKMTYHMFDE